MNQSKTKKQFIPTIMCRAIQDISIHPGAKKVIIDDRQQSKISIKVLAINNGFESVQEFWTHFSQEEEFNGRIIHWTPLRY